MGRPLCCFVVEPDHRACRQTCVYAVQVGNHIKTVCGTHRMRVAGEVIGRLGPARRDLYRANLNHTVKTPVIVEWPEPEWPSQRTERNRTVALYATATTTEFDPEQLAPEDELIDGFVKSVEAYEGTKYGTNEPQTKAKITLEGTGEYAGKTADKIYALSLHELSHLRPIFTAITGIVPVDDEQYDVEALLKGKPCRFMATHIKTDRGGIFARIETVKPPRAAKAKKPVVVVEEDDEDDSDLDDA